MPMKRTRAKREVKNLSAHLALVFILSQIKLSDFCNYDRYIPIKKVIFLYQTKTEPNGGSIFSQENKFSNNTCLLNRWG